jgi:glycine cleavage system transcriptional repressor
MPDHNLVAVTVVGNDRPGIVAGVTRVLYDLGCNLEDVTSTILRGHFAMMLIVRPSKGVTPEAIEEGLGGVATGLSLVVSARAVDDAALDFTAPTHMVSVYGADRPGIVFRVAQLLSDQNVNVTDLTSRVIGEESEPVYALMLEVAVPADLDLAASLAEVARELEVEVSVHPVEADLL